MTGFQYDLMIIQKWLRAYCLLGHGHPVNTCTHYTADTGPTSWKVDIFGSQYIVSQLTRCVLCVHVRVCSGHRRGPRRRASGCRRRSRSEYNGVQLAVLTTEFYICQYLTLERRVRLATLLSLTESQVKIWFQNRRAKMKKERRSHRDANTCAVLKVNWRHCDVI